MTSRSNAPEPLSDADASRHPGTATLCLGCGCLCDDVTVDVDSEGLPRSATGFCPLGEAWLDGVSNGTRAADCLVEGRPVSANVAIDRAAAFLREARRPVVYGVSQATTEAVRATLGLADRLGALFLLSSTEESRAASASFQDLGRVKATLGEVKNRADVVVFWGCDPLTTHPRHGERYSIDAPGRFLPGGRADRTIVVVHEKPTETEALADRVWKLPAGQELEILVTLRWLVSRTGTLVQPSRIGSGDLETLEELAALFRDARYGALFYKPLPSSAGVLRPAWDAMSLLVRDLCLARPFRLLTLGSAGNPAGAEAAMGWQAGFAPGVDFRLGAPAPVDEVDSLCEVLERGEIDALLVVADPPPEALSDEARRRLATVPRIVVAPQAERWAGLTPTVSLPSATLGWGEAGTVWRVDGIALPLASLITAPVPGVAEWIDRLGRALLARPEPGPAPGDRP